MLEIMLAYLNCFIPSGHALFHNIAIVIIAYSLQMDQTAITLLVHALFSSEVSSIQNLNKLIQL